VPIFPNTQDIPALAREVAGRLSGPTPLRHGFLIRRHGLYTWGRDIDEACRHVEIFEFLFEVLGRRLGLPARVE
jgi:methylthioribulose-1-phosphate dehydratase